ncbi:glycosyltransferase family 2 protein [Algibacter miyuki]|uniref:Glycosyltransferase family 2 protein n=1 Tax=Algibacter miyuki TaxID=1306933 RepID=A0ABV5H2A9_9FLAO|nr:glycosyltransferase family 2 protein [Algibacter miyuki]MDN3666483.1 glycosyltransferase family 2 protein [Algibacter miyuki]
MIGINNKKKIIGVSRVRNEGALIKDVLDHLSNYVDGVICYDDASEDNTLDILKKHPLVLDIIENKNWKSDRKERSKAEGAHRQQLFDKAKEYSPEWIYVFDADEFVEFKEGIDLNDENFDAYYFRLYDYYITAQDVSKNYKEREFIGPEYRDIPMLFRASLDLNFHSRVPKGFGKISFGGYVKHYGKATTVEAWDRKCEYYINHLVEKQPGDIDISEKWTARLGKAIHNKSDFFNDLITWESKEDFGIELTPGLERLSTYSFNILVATSSLDSIGGSETFTYAIIEELSKYPKFNVEYFTFNKGSISEKIEKNLGVGFMSFKKYDLILANHNTVVEKLYKRGTIIQTCHGIYPKLEQPSKKATGFVAISQEVQNHLGVKGFASKLIYNSINLNRFFPKKEIKKKPKTVLSLCHSEEANSVIMKLAKDLGLEYLQAFKYENPIWNIEDLINKADLVFGLGRSAYEAMSCGRPVIVYDKRRYFAGYSDGYVKDVLGFSLVNNCSGRYSKKELTLDQLKIEVQKYNSDDQYFFRGFADKELDIRKNMVKYIDYYLVLKYLKYKNKPSTKIKSILKKIIKKALGSIKKNIKKL